MRETPSDLPAQTDPISGTSRAGPGETPIDPHTMPHG